ncbi:Hypothetical protein CAP_4662 [Chondromyces apiculatus DSM 436]|uniref:Uncharacterized protein n=1 Tax=Chondromyces apiculatus DSM 436 TaxID=1192034 RepID=A0A017T5W6_9BACT|nr:Hypothetical protein CAP_4662 [Chondromyces apiculatus DSM 436]
MHPEVQDPGSPTPRGRPVVVPRVDLRVAPLPLVPGPHHG